MRSSRTAGRDDEDPAPRRTGLEARIADALVTRLVESRFSEALMEQILAALTESRDVEQLVVHLLRKPDVTAAIEQLVVRLVRQPEVTATIEQLVIQLVREPDVTATVEELVIQLLARPAVTATVDGIVDRQLGRVIQALRQSEEVRVLVREQADLYLQHLTENPEPVRQLIQDQSRGMVRDLVASVRAWAFIADDTVDGWVHRVLGRP